MTTGCLLEAKRRSMETLALATSRGLLSAWKRGSDERLSCLHEYPKATDELQE